jgi:beta-N-acetylhexosaminidase
VRAGGAGAEVPLPSVPSLRAAPPEPVTEVRRPRIAEHEVEVEAWLARLTLEQKVGQLLMVGFKGTEVTAEVEALVRGRQVGGVCLFRRNVESAEQVARLNAELRGLFRGGVPPFLALDQEGGSVVRVRDGNLVLPGNMALGATHEPELAYRAGRAQAEDLLLLGFNMNLAPVLDVNLNPRNPVIGLRSFGDEPEAVAQFGAQFVKGQQDAQLVTVAKHFPGHGNTEEDSHLALPVMQETRQEVMAQLLPFTRAIEAGLDGLMTAHVAIPRVTGHGHPATLSPELLDGLLRGELGFTGLVVTDELEMEAIAARYGVGKAAVMSVNAGADMVLVPWRPERKTEVWRALLDAARTGELSPERLDTAVRRVLATKLRRGLFVEPSPVAERLAKLGAPERLEVGRLIAERAVTLLRTDGRYFPLPPGAKVAVLTAEPALGEALAARLPDAEIVVLPAFPNARARAAYRAQAREVALRNDIVVVGLVNSRQVDLVRMAAAANKPVVAVSLGLPYLASEVDEARAVLAVYSWQASAAEAAAAALTGEQGTPGRLPVSLNAAYRFGHGLDPVGRPVASGVQPLTDPSLQ